MAKKIILYGNENCPDCMVLKGLLDEAGIRYGYVDLLAGLAHFKKFLGVRDNNPEAFASAIAVGSAGIPTVVVDDTEVHVLHVVNAETDLSAFR